MPDYRDNDADDNRLMSDEAEPTTAEMRQVVAQVSAYRAISEQIRAKSTGTIAFGLFMIGVWYFVDGQNNNWGIFSILYLSLGVLELSVGLLNRLFPSPEGLLLDGLVMFAFAASNGIRQYLIYQAVGEKGINPIFLIFAAMWLFQGIQTIRQYFVIKQVLPINPSRNDLRWFDGLVKELRDADPVTDSRALAIPTSPFLAGKLLGENAFFLDPDSAMLVAHRRDVQIEQVSQTTAGEPLAVLVVEGNTFPQFKLSDANWNNYSAWKREGGENPILRTPTIPTVQPVREPDRLG